MMADTPLENMDYLMDFSVEIFATTPAEADVLGEMITEKVKELCKLFTMTSHVEALRLGQPYPNNDP